MKKKHIWNIVIILVIVAIGAFFFLRDTGEVTLEEAQCIGANSVLYVQTGCHACQIQEDMFGDFYEELTMVDCLGDIEKCTIAGINATPTWIINDNLYAGVQSIEKLKQLTGC